MALYSSVIYTEPRPSSTLINLPEPAWYLAPGRSLGAAAGTARGRAGRRAPQVRERRSGAAPRVERGVRAAVPAGLGRPGPINFPCSVPASRRGTNAEQIETYPLRN